MSCSSSDEDMEYTPPDLKEAASSVIQNLFPAKSRDKYLKAYDNFMKWRVEKHASSFSENIFLAYFNELSKTKMPSTLWAIYSMIKFTVNIKHNIDIKHYSNLTALLKRLSDGFKSKKSPVFTSENITQFLNDAPDDRYLVTKVALVLGVNGACRTIELYNITIKDINRHENELWVKLRDTKTKIDRVFVVKDEYLPIIQKYQALRPASTTSDKFFLQYKNGKCHNQVIGRHKMSTFPKEIAVFLNLANGNSYTGHCFRRTSATLLADSGGSLISLKRHGGWKSDKVAEGYIEESKASKRNIKDLINKNIQYTDVNNQTSTSNHDNSYPNTSKHFDQQATYSTKFPMPSQPPCHQDSPIIDTNLPPQTSITNTQAEIQTTTISLPGKTTHITFNNCTNITFNLK